MKTVLILKKWNTGIEKSGHRNVHPFKYHCVGFLKQSLLYFDTNNLVRGLFNYLMIRGRCDILDNFPK